VEHRPQQADAPAQVLALGEGGDQAALDVAGPQADRKLLQRLAKRILIRFATVPKGDVDVETGLDPTTALTLS